MNDLPVFEILMGLGGGLAIFLFGMEQMTDALKAVAGSRMSSVLAKLTRNRFMSAITGAFVTAVIQSSSVTTVLVVGFISAGLMTLQQSIGIIVGANVGTTITAQVIAFKVTHYALLLVAIGFGMLFASKKKKIKRYGGMIMGLGMVFFGMALMSDATNPLRSYQPFIDLMGQMSNPILGIAVAAVFTALVQSSSATTGIVIVLASQGFITLEAGIALVFGANLGTCVTAMLAAAGKPVAAKQAAAAHLAFNIIGVIIWIPFIGFLASTVTSMSPVHEALTGTARLAAETPRQIANAHTVFNIANALLFIGFTAPLARVITRLIPEKPEVVPPAAQPKFLDETLLQTPVLALDRIRMEAVHLGEGVADLISRARPAVISGTSDDLDAILADGVQLRRLHHAIMNYARQVSAADLADAETESLASLNVITNNIQHVGETVSLAFVAIGRERLQQDLRFSDETMRLFQVYVAKVMEAFELALTALDQKELTLAQDVVAMKPTVQALASDIVEHLGRRLVADDPHRATLYRLESQMVEIVQRMYYFAKKICKQILEDADPESGASGVWD